ncbi:hypothetical protein CK203_066373 [Vitis vinifera]|uniref:Uncharacterized protein n=1 Tax=Vitis vinifera TaxID=29760 RepID=A0A438G3I0_VITVI|nr:hypothetical protein CK203_066373 [Vitis vinifera]
MPVFDNPSFLRLGLGSNGLRITSSRGASAAIWGSGIGAEAPELFLGVPEMVPAMELELLQVRELAREPGDCSVKSIGSELSTLVSSSMADRLTLLNIALPAALVAPASLEKVVVSTAKALEQVLEQNLDLAPFADSFCGSKGMKILPLAFVPFWAIDLWPALLNGEDDREKRTAWLGEEDEGAARMAALIFETLFAALLTGINRKNGSPGVSLSFATKRQFRSNLPFSQQLRSEFRSCEIDVTVLRSGTRCAKTTFAIAKYLRNRTFGAKSRFSISQRFRSCEMMPLFCEVALVCQTTFAMRNTLAEASTVLRNGLAAKCQFRRSFLHPAKFRRALFFPCFCSVSAPISADFFSFQFP